MAGYLAHGSGPEPGGRWSELHVVFDGPAFDGLRACGLLDPAAPVHHAEPVAVWRSRLEGAVQMPELPPLPAKIVQLSRFLQTLTEMLQAQTGQIAQEPAW
ncbi:MAG TPA: hypothetical protein VHA37_05625, partial [Candidatus Saccharimonadales bacterium]|nr:hypothetical protein [Candidatus Saccharimonadales bacterium]